MGIRRRFSLCFAVTLASGGLASLTTIPAAFAEEGVASSEQSAYQSDFGVGETGDLSAAEQTRFDEVSEILASYPEDLDNYSEELATEGLALVSEPAPEVEASSLPRDVSIPRPYVYYDRQARRYYAAAKYSWRENDRQYFDSSSSCDANESCPIGGPDGFGLRFSGNIVNRTVNAIFCGRKNVGRDFNQYGCFRPRPSDNSSAGVSYRPQDRVHRTVVKPDLNIYNGTITVAIDGIRCGRTVQLFSRYGHGWDNTSMTGFGISTTGFSVTWSSSSDNWAVSSQSGTWRRC